MRNAAVALVVARALYQNATRPAPTPSRPRIQLVAPLASPPKFFSSSLDFPSLHHVRYVRWFNALSSFSLSPSSSPRLCWPAPVPKNRRENVPASNPTTSFFSAPSPIFPQSRPLLRPHLRPLTPPPLPIPRLQTPKPLRPRLPPRPTATLRSSATISTSTSVSPAPTPRISTSFPAVTMAIAVTISKKVISTSSSLSRKPKAASSPPFATALAEPPTLAPCSPNCGLCAITTASPPSSACCIAPTRPCSNPPTIPTIRCQI